MQRQTDLSPLGVSRVTGEARSKEDGESHQWEPVPEWMGPGTVFAGQAFQICHFPIGLPMGAEGLFLHPGENEDGGIAQKCGFLYFFHPLFISQEKLSCVCVCVSRPPLEKGCYVSYISQCLRTKGISDHGDL